MLYESRYPRHPRDLNDSYNACMRDEKQKYIVEPLKKGWHFPGLEQLSSVLKLLQLSTLWFMSKSVTHLGHYGIIKVLYIFPFHFYLKKKKVNSFPILSLSGFWIFFYFWNRRLFMKYFIFVKMVWRLLDVTSHFKKSYKDYWTSFQILKSEIKAQI